ncbi:hypothetical protein BS47DRAFT_141571 [Hydnum rufescens UP504]|uniref:Uncharacterized protein n=1 Tax=Hydnum rufescens UP504 TaxID=1448309 RepID=A0A9P6APN2_9AGAM|nr:hypothetical protein BS47DRAFT_141571 [Hydnum rufescens UP504]
MSSGSGVQRETVQALVWRLILDPQTARNVAPKFGDKLVFVPSTTSSAIPSSTVQLQHAFEKGVAISLSVLICGHFPLNYSPLQYYLAVHNGDINALTRQVLQMLAPDLLRVLREFRAIGFQGDLRPLSAHLMSHVDINPADIEHRTEEAHDRLEELILLRSLFGNTDLHHPEMLAFAQGLKMEMANGTNLFQLIEQKFLGRTIGFLEKIESG